jgi:hypothetical protein
MNIYYKLGGAFLIFAIHLFLPGCEKQAEVEPARELVPGELALLRPKIPLWQPTNGANQVIRSLVDWHNAWKQAYADSRSGFSPRDRLNDVVPAAPPVDLDFEKNIILIVFGGSNADHQSMEIVSARLKGNTVQVEVNLNTCLPPPDHASVAAVYTIGDAVAIKKTNQEIVFNFVQTNACPHPKPKQNTMRGYDPQSTAIRF